MNDDFFKVKLIKKENYIMEGQIEVSEDKNEEEIVLVMDKNSKIINKESYDKLFSGNNKDRDKENLKRKNPYSYEHKPQQKKTIDPEKRQYAKLTCKQLEDQIEQVKKNINEIKNKTTNKEEIIKYEKLSQKWLKISQEAIYTILEMFPQNQNYDKNTIKSVLQHFKIEKEALNYNSEDECFD
jgi:hypothetical protein